MSERESKSAPFYKKWWFWAIIAVVLLIIYIVSPKATDSSRENVQGSVNDSSVESDEKEEPINYSYETGTTERIIEEKAIQRIKNNYEDTEIDHVTINEDAGTDTPDDYIVLAYVKWNRKNKENTTKEMLRMYCDDFAAGLGKDLPNVSEAVMFWSVPYHGESTSKCSYERANNGMLLSDKTGLIGDK